MCRAGKYCPAASAPPMAAPNIASSVEIRNARMTTYTATIVARTMPASANMLTGRLLLAEQVLEDGVQLEALLVEDDRDVELLPEGREAAVLVAVPADDQQLRLRT